MFSGRTQLLSAPATSEMETQRRNKGRKRMRIAGTRITLTLMMLIVNPQMSSVDVITLQFNVELPTEDIYLETDREVLCLRRNILYKIE